MPTAKRVRLFARSVAKRWNNIRGGGPRVAGRWRVDQRCERRVKSRRWRKESPAVVLSRKRMKCGNVRAETQEEVQGQWWSILGIHLGEFG